MSLSLSSISNDIKTCPILIFSKSYCPHSQKGVAAIFTTLTEIGLTDVQIDSLLKIIQLDLDCDDTNSMNAIQDELEKQTQARSVPRIFVNAHFIGGADDTIEMRENGTLMELLEPLAKLRSIPTFKKVI